MKKLHLLFPICLLTNIALQAQDLTVCASGCDHMTIAAAIAAASSGDVIEIQDATHTEDNIVINKNITIQGQGRNSTLIQSANSVAFLDDGIFNISANLTVTIKDLTLINGYASASGSSTEEVGGAILVTMSAGSNISLTNLQLIDNEADDSGGAIFIKGSSGTLNMTECIVSNNSAAGSGGAISSTASGTSMNFTRCSFLNNLATVSSGTILLNGSSCDATFTNCTFAGNTAGTMGSNSTAHGAAVSIFSTNTCTFLSCTIAFNTILSNPITAGAIYFQGTSPATLNLINTIVSNTVNKSDVFIISGTVNATNNLVQTCLGGCPSWAYTSDPMLATAATCRNGQTFYAPQSNPGLNTGSTPPSDNVPSTDICNVPRESPHDMGARDAAVALPVTLNAFIAEALPDGNLLKWQTATELNNSGFEIERSTNGLTWETLSFIQGQGTSFQAKSYSYMDDAPIKGINYYRLKQIDTDDTFEYSKVISVISFSAENDGKLLLSPNPISTELNITNGQGVATFYNLLGQVVKQMNIPDQQFKTELSELPSGQYVLTIERTDGSQVTGRFIK